jgi:cell division protein FtsB
MEQEADVKIDENAKQYIIELETINDLQRAELEELREENKIVKAQIRAIQNGQKVDYRVA